MEAAMIPYDISVLRDGDTLHATFRRMGYPPLSTRTKFRRRRLHRLMLSATKRATLSFVGKSVTGATIAAVTAVADEACKAAMVRYNHLFY